MSHHGPGIGRRLQAPGTVQNLCGGRVRVAYTHTTLESAEVHFGLFDEAAPVGLWSPGPLVGSPRAGAIRVRCAGDELHDLRASYSGLVLDPLVRSIRPIGPRRPPVRLSTETALLVLPDYHNFFHQFGSLVIAWAALRESSVASNRAVRIFMLNNASLAPTASFWSPGLSLLDAPRFVRSPPSPPPAAYARVVLVQPATETWWWHVWSVDATDRRALLRPLTAQLSARLLPPVVPASWRADGHGHGVRTDGGRAEGGRADSDGRATAASHAFVSGVDTLGAGGLSSVSGAGGVGALVALVVSRPLGADRRILNEGSLVDALARAFRDEASTLPSASPSVTLSTSPSASPSALPSASAPLTPQLVALGALSTVQQLRLVAGAGLLVGTHGAGLLWNLFLPPGAPVLEILNAANANQYYANHCRWLRRPYGAWQNTRPDAEQPAVDPDTGTTGSSFRNHVRVDEHAVAQLAVRLLRDADRLRLAVRNQDDSLSSTAQSSIAQHSSYNIV